MQKKLSEHIIKLCQERDSSSQRSLYEHYSYVVRLICLHYASNKDEAKDFLQEIFIKIFTSIDGYNFKGSFDGWVKRIANNYCINQISRNKNYTEPLDENTFEVEYENDSESKYNNFSKEQIMSALESLDSTYKIVFNLYVLEGLSHKEISKLLDISEANSRIRLNRARNLLKKKLVNNC